MAGILGIEYALPEKVITNEELAKLFANWSAEKIFSKTGIRSRHVTTENETAADLGVVAAQKLIKKNIVPKDAVDFILCVTQSPDYKLPSSACIIQDRLGLSTKSGAFDFNLGCSGYEYGLAVAKGLVLGGIAKNILLLTAETYTKYIHPEDHAVRPLFGDAATATVISACDEKVSGISCLIITRIICTTHLHSLSNIAFSISHHLINR